MCSVGVKVSVFLRLEEPSLRVFTVVSQAEDLLSLSEKVSPTGRGLLLVAPHPPVPVDLTVLDWDCRPRLFEGAWGGYSYGL